MKTLLLLAAAAMTLTTPAAAATLSDSIRADMPQLMALYRDIHSLDPITAFDYPEDTVISTLCDALQRQQPDGSVTAGLADGAYRTPTSLVLDVRPNVVFWDGTPLTADDVAYSLERNLDPNLISLYTNVFDRVESIDVMIGDQSMLTVARSGHAHDLPITDAAERTVFTRSRPADVEPSKQLP